MGASVLALFIVAGIVGSPRQQPGTAPTTPSAAAPVAVPADLVGKNAAEARKTLTDLGITSVDYKSVDGRTVVIPENWTVTAVEDTTEGRARRIVLRVDKPQPTTTPRPTTTAATTAPAPPPVEPDVPTPDLPDPGTDVPPPAEVYYKNCAAAKAAGAAPIHRGQPGYRSQLDGDGDGTACDK
ncbi:excalibur calcium-binding domain-containing protein [Actinokineospora enzanensis]|uniref:excalibur calcium-binding domain-containing protein n=1 Tax=Actinokineospora enzanensis TaxID=155975 RepID=UPI0003670E45|nr:excalibur calcium-binding domain-containing protein [Actinokineospora enzanensis]